MRDDALKAPLRGELRRSVQFRREGVREIKEPEWEREGGKGREIRRESTSGMQLRKKRWGNDQGKRCSPCWAKGTSVRESERCEKEQIERQW